MLSVTQYFLGLQPYTGCKNVQAILYIDLDRDASLTQASYEMVTF